VWMVGVYLGLMMALPAFAAPDDAPTNAPYSGICTMPQACMAQSGCAMMPVLGELLIRVTARETSLGQSEADLARLDHFATLQEALPLPRIEGFRRSFLVDLPSVGAIRRFAVHVQLIDAESGAPVLRPRYFVLECTQVPR